MEWPFIWSVATSSSTTAVVVLAQVRSACKTPTCPGGTSAPQDAMSRAHPEPPVRNVRMKADANRFICILLRTTRRSLHPRGDYTLHTQRSQEKSAPTRRSPEHDHPAIHGDHLSGHHLRIVGGEPHGGPGQIAGLERAMDRHLEVDDEVQDVLRHALARRLGERRTGRDRV